MTIVFWLFIMALRLAVFALGKGVNIMICTVFVFKLLSTLYIYIAIYITVRRRPRIRETGEAERWITQAINEKTKLQNIKLAKSCAIVVGVSMTCNIPFPILFSLPINDVFCVLVLWSMTIVLSSSSLNSLVFFWNNSVLRREAKRLFKKLN